MESIDTGAGPRQPPAVAVVRQLMSEVGGPGHWSRVSHCTGRYIYT